MYFSSTDIESSKHLTNLIKDAATIIGEPPSQESTATKLERFKSIAELSNKIYNQAMLGCDSCLNEGKKVPNVVPQIIIGECHISITANPFQRNKLTANVCLLDSTIIKQAKEFLTGLNIEHFDRHEKDLVITTLEPEVVLWLIDSRTPMTDHLINVALSKDLVLQ